MSKNLFESELIVKFLSKMSQSDSKEMQSGCAINGLSSLFYLFKKFTFCYHLLIHDHTRFPLLQLFLKFLPNNKNFKITSIIFPSIKSTIFLFLIPAL